jgi:hypothetical protein
MEGPVPNIGLPEMLFGLVLWIVPVVLTAWLAAKKGYGPAVWTIIAIFITWIALIIVLVLPNRTRTA